MRLLLIDDELPVIQSLELTLKPAGHECVLFQNPVEGVEAFKNEHFDVVVTDFKMPEMNGIEVLKEIRKYNSDVYVIILTGYADINNAIGSVNNGAYAFFRKPLNFQDLINTLNQIEDEIKSDKEKEVNLNLLSIEYKNLKAAFESLTNVVEKPSTGCKENQSDD